MLARLLLAGALQRAYLSQILGEDKLRPKAKTWATTLARAVIAAGGAPTR